MSVTSGLPFCMDEDKENHKREKDIVECIQDIEQELWGMVCCTEGIYLIYLLDIQHPFDHQTLLDQHIIGVTNWTIAQMTFILISALEQVPHPDWLHTMTNRPTKSTTRIIGHGTLWLGPELLGSMLGMESTATTPSKQTSSLWTGPTTTRTLSSWPWRSKSRASVKVFYHA